MRDRRYIIGGVLSCLLATIPASGMAARASTRPASDRPVEPADPDVEWLRAILNNSATESRVRQGAAERLLAKGTPAALKVLKDAIAREPALIALVLAAMDASQARPPEMLGLLVQALSTAPREQWPALAHAISGYEEAGLQAVVDIADDRRRGPSERLGAISALSHFRVRDAARVLVGLLDQERGEPADVLTTSMSGLERMSGMTYGDAAAWRQWWEQVKDLEPGEWNLGMVKIISEQLAARQRESDALKLEVARVGTRLAEVYGEVFLNLTASQRLERLPRLLGDDIPAVRLFALGQIDRMLRNGERPPESLQQIVLERLTDLQPQVRIRAARLLDDLGVASAGDAIAAAMVTEKDPEVQGAYLAVLANRSSAKAVDAVIRGLGDPLLAPAAAKAAEKMIESGTFDDGSRSDLIEEARYAVDAHPDQAVWRLLTSVGTPEDVDLAIAELAVADSSSRAGIAEGLRKRGRLEALIQHADDEAVYPSTVMALSDGPADLDRFRQLAELKPPRTQRETWATAVVRLAAGLSIADLAAADDLLKSIPESDDRLRALVLERAADVAPAESQGAIIALQQRLIRLWLSGCDGRRAAELLDRIGAAASGTEWAEERFRTSIATAKFAQAATIKPACRDWLDALTWLARCDVTTALALHEEIGRRFVDDLNGDMLKEYDAAKALLAKPAVPTASVPMFR